MIWPIIAGAASAKLPVRPVLEREEISREAEDSGMSVDTLSPF